MIMNLAKYLSRTLGTGAVPFWCRAIVPCRDLLTLTVTVMLTLTVTPLASRDSLYSVTLLKSLKNMMSTK
jgi:hypothetical protein